MQKSNTELLASNLRETARKPALLIIDDQTAVLNALRRLLHKVRCVVHTAQNESEAMRICDAVAPGLVICDQHMPGFRGTELLRKIAAVHPDSCRVILSSHCDFEEIVQAFNDRVIDRFLTKPWDNREVLSLVNSALGVNFNSDHRFHDLISIEPNMWNLFRQIKRLAKSNVPVCIQGETGTGKELIAKAFHEESDRRFEPFIGVSCSTFSHDLALSQLFGHKKGAFTGAIEDHHGIFHSVGKGTLFLDEVTSMDLRLQAKLLRVLQERKYTPIGTNKLLYFHGQVISASNVPLKRAVGEGLFREDLQYRLDVIPIEIPRLSDRPRDIPLLMIYFLNNINPSVSWSLTEETVYALGKFHWPGNIRQLQNVAHWLAATCSESQIRIENLPVDICDYSEPTELQRITRALLAHRNNKTQAARSLGISRMTLWRKMKSLDLIS
jgi:DNA-binding NtrC family response regulator